jgi:hypothetical protein
VDTSPKHAKIVKRILEESGNSDLVEILSERLSPTDLQSLLMSVYRIRAATRRGADLVDQHGTNRFVRCSDVNPAEAAAFDVLAYSLLPTGFEPVELSPLSPFGSCSALGPVDQNNVVTTTRNTEVCSDPTNVLAIEAAARQRLTTRRGRAEVGPSEEPTRLCASQRVVRGQNVSGPASFAHFRVFTLCTAGRTRGNLLAESEAFVEHIRYYSDLIRQSSQLGYSVLDQRITVIPFTDEAEKRVPEVIRALSNDADVETSARREEKTDYYRHFRFNIHATNERSEEYFLVDGGLTSWTAQLLSDRKQYCMTSGMGSERFIFCFRRGAARS